MLLDGPVSHTSIQWILAKFSMIHWICVLFILLILVHVELPLCIVVMVLSYNLFSGVKLVIRSFRLLSRNQDCLFKTFWQCLVCLFCAWNGIVFMHLCSSWSRGGTLQLKIRGGGAGSRVWGLEFCLGKDILGFFINIDLDNS